MHNLKLQSVGQYRNKKGTLVFRYKVSGSPSAMEAFEDAQGEYFVQDQETGDVLYFSGLLTGSFSYVGSGALAGGGNSSASFNNSTKLLTVDTNGDGTSDMQMTLTGLNGANLTAADFIWT